MFTAGPTLQNKHENILICYINPEKKRAMQHFSFRQDEDRGTVLSFNIPTGNEIVRKGDHSSNWLNPCQKPRQLLTYFIQHFSHQGDWVLDLCSGTGTTTVAALMEGRNCVAVENDSTMRKAISQRVHQLKIEMNRRAEEMKEPQEKEEQREKKKKKAKQDEEVEFWKRRKYFSTFFCFLFPHWHSSSFKKDCHRCVQPYTPKDVIMNCLSCLATVHDHCQYLPESIFFEGSNFCSYDCMKIMYVDTPPRDELEAQYPDHARELAKYEEEGRRVRAEMEKASKEQAVKEEEQKKRRAARLQAKLDSQEGKKAAKKRHQPSQPRALLPQLQQQPPPNNKDQPPQRTWPSWRPMSWRQVKQSNS